MNLKLQMTNSTPSSHTICLAHHTSTSQYYKVNIPNGKQHAHSSVLYVYHNKMNVFWIQKANNTNAQNDAINFNLHYLSTWQTPPACLILPQSVCETFEPEVYKQYVSRTSTNFWIRNIFLHNGPHPLVLSHQQLHVQLSTPVRNIRISERVKMTRTKPQSTIFL